MYLCTPLADISTMTPVKKCTCVLNRLSNTESHDSIPQGYYITESTKVIGGHSWPETAHKNLRLYPPPTDHHSAGRLHHRDEKRQYLRARNHCELMKPDGEYVRMYQALAQMYA